MKRLTIITFVYTIKYIVCGINSNFIDINICVFKEYCKTCLPSNHTIFCTFHGEERFKLFKIYYVVIILISLREQCYLHL